MIEIDENELQIFCGILSDAYEDSYIKPCDEIGDIPSKNLKAWFDLYQKKRAQVEDRNPSRLHFGWDEKISDPIAFHERLFEQMKDDLLHFGKISGALQLKKAYFAWGWLLKYGVHMPSSIQKRLLRLKIQIDNSPLSKSDKKHLAIQSMAQVIGYLHGRVDTKRFKNYIAEVRQTFPSILYLDSWKSIRDYQKNQKRAENSSDPKDLMRDIEKWVDSVRLDGKKTVLKNPRPLPKVLNQFLDCLMRET